jgi:hypothetical protein
VDVFDPADLRKQLAVAAKIAAPQQLRGALRQLICQRDGVPEHWA